MSIASEMTSLAANRDAIKAAIEAKNPAVAPGTGLASFPAAIASIPEGGEENIADILGLPEAEWRDDGDTWMFIDLSRRLPNASSRTFSFGATGRFKVDWGDGTPEESVSQDGRPPPAVTHTYAEGIGDRFAIRIRTDGSDRVSFGYNNEGGTFRFPESYPIYGFESGANTNISMGKGGSGLNEGRYDALLGNAPVRAHVGAGRKSAGFMARSLNVSPSAAAEVTFGEGAVFEYGDEFGPQFSGILDGRMDMKKIVSPDGRRWKSMSNMFQRSRLPASPDMSGFDTSLVESFSNMFSGCSAVRLDLSGFDFHSATDMSVMFADCYFLSEVEFPQEPSKSTHACTNMRDMFYGCRALYSLDVSWMDTANVTSMYDMFRRCSDLTYLSLAGWDTSSVTNMSAMFLDCSNIPDLDISEFDMSNVTDASQMFQGCTSMKRVVLPSSLTKVFALMFNACEDCLLYDFRAATSVPTLDNVNAFQNTNAGSQIVVPDELYDTWVAASNWATYASRITKASEYQE